MSFLTFCMLVGVFAMYCLPTLVAHNRGHHNLAAIAALNLLLGWSGIGWVLSLVWSLTSKS